MVEVEDEGELALSKQGLLELLPLLAPVVLAYRDTVEVLQCQAPAVGGCAWLLVDGRPASARALGRYRYMVQA